MSASIKERLAAMGINVVPVDVAAGHRAEYGARALVTTSGDYLGTYTADAARIAFLVNKDSEGTHDQP